MQQNGIQDAENGRVGSHAQSQRQNSHDREQGLLDQHAQTIANILKQSPHEDAPAPGTYAAKNQCLQEK
jgi:hypothetical protein